MTLQFKNEHIYFAIDSIWQTLDYKYKNLLHQLITANPDNDFVQTVEVPEHILIQIFSTVTVLPEGVSAGINQQMLLAIMQQVQPLAAFTDGELGDEPNEAMRILLAINEIDIANKAIKAEKILAGKNSILS